MHNSPLPPSNFYVLRAEIRQSLGRSDRPNRDAFFRYFRNLSAKDESLPHGQKPNLRQRASEQWWPRIWNGEPVPSHILIGLLGFLNRSANPKYEFEEIAYPTSQRPEPFGASRNQISFRSLLAAVDHRLDLTKHGNIAIQTSIEHPPAHSHHLRSRGNDLWQCWDIYGTMFDSEEMLGKICLSYLARSVSRNDHASACSKSKFDLGGDSNGIRNLVVDVETSDVGAIGRGQRHRTFCVLTAIARALATISGGRLCVSINFSSSHVLFPDSLIIGDRDCSLSSVAKLQPHYFEERSLETLIQFFRHFGFDN